MPKWKWSDISLENLGGIHPDLRRLCDEALRTSEIDFRVIDGIRTMKEQKHFVAIGASKTLKSRHLHGFAVDVAALPFGKVRWEDQFYVPIREAFRKASIKFDIPLGKVIKWDMGHFELDKKRYPDP